MSEGSVCRHVVRSGAWSEAHGRIALDYEGRFLRRRRLVAADGSSFLVDLAETTSVGNGDAFALEDGRLIAVEAAEEPLYAVRGDLSRLAWHVGNRHTPCAIEAGRLLIRRDRVMRDMLAQLGAEIKEVSEPFVPEGGAYGHGRTMGHAHGDLHSHHEHGDRGHDHDHGHGHGHPREQAGDRHGAHSHG